MLTADQVRFYQENGYVIPDLALSFDVIAEIKDHHDRLLRRRPEFTDYCGALLIEDLSFLNYARNPDILDLVEPAP